MARLRWECLISGVQHLPLTYSHASASVGSLPLMARTRSPTVDGRLSMSLVKRSTILEYVRLPVASHTQAIPASEQADIHAETSRSLQVACFPLWSCPLIVVEPSETLRPVGLTSLNLLAGSALGVGHGCDKDAGSPGSGGFGSDGDSAACCSPAVVRAAGLLLISEVVYSALTGRCDLLSDVEGGFCTLQAP